ncbi:hypothetical protein GJ496_000321 [Pomphorhynchus laevis]|nr:hypothetical protein GJ496_000321 [Pomphorhynchus laevis]
MQDTSDFVTLDMECTSYGCRLRTYVKAPRSVSRSFFVQEFFCGQCMAQKLSGLKEKLMNCDLILVIPRQLMYVCGIANVLQRMMLIHLLVLYAMR